MCILMQFHNWIRRCEAGRKRRASSDVLFVVYVVLYLNSSRLRVQTKAYFLQLGFDFFVRIPGTKQPNKRIRLLMNGCLAIRGARGKHRAYCTNCGTWSVGQEKRLPLALMLNKHESKNDATKCAENG